MNRATAKRTGRGAKAANIGSRTTLRFVSMRMSSAPIQHQAHYTA